MSNENTSKPLETGKPQQQINLDMEIALERLRNKEIEIIMLLGDLKKLNEEISTKDELIKNLNGQLKFKEDGDKNA